jgi:hypothetical protein
MKSLATLKVGQRMRRARRTMKRMRRTMKRTRRTMKRTMSLVPLTYFVFRWTPLITSPARVQHHLDVQTESEAGAAV